MDFETKVSPERFAQIRKRCLELPGMSHENRANRIAAEFPDLSPKTLRDYSCMGLACTEKVWSLFMAGKLRISVLRQIYSMEPDDQDFFVDECIEKQMEPSVVQKIRQYRKELDMGFPECIAKALEEAKITRSNAMKEMHRQRSGNSSGGEMKTEEGAAPKTTVKGASEVEQKLTREIGADIRKKCRDAYGKTHEARALMLAKEYPGFSVRTLEGYSRIANNCSEKVWNLLAEGKVALTTVEEMCDWEIADQNKIIDECVARNMKLTVRQIRLFKKGGTLGGIEEAFAVPTPAPAPAPEKAPAPEAAPTPDPVTSEEGDDSSGGDATPFESKISREKSIELRATFRNMDDHMSQEARAEAVLKDFPGVSQSTLEKYCRISLQCTEKVWNLYGEGKANLAWMAEICSLEPGDQDFLIDECIAKNLKVPVIRKIRRFRKEHGWGFPECIAKATGEVPLNQPRKESGHRKSLDSILDEIAKNGARWRAMVTMAIEMVGKEEASAGIHEEIFKKVYILRELIGNQYDFVNSRLQRYMTMIRKHLQADMPVTVDVVQEQPGEEMTGGDAPDFSPIPEGEKKPLPDRAAEPEGTEQENLDG